MSQGGKKQPNRLIHEKSPYLLQHAYNPVDWYPWSPEAFKKSKAEDKPIFLSRFWDNKGMGFFFTSDCAESLFLREKEIYDGAILNWRTWQHNWPTAFRGM